MTDSKEELATDDVIRGVQGWLDEKFIAAFGSRRAQARAFEAQLKAWSEKNERKFTAEVKGDTLELVVMDVIGDFFFGGVSANSIKRELDRAPNAKKIRVLVNSPGGDAFDGISIRSLLKRHPATVTVEILGEAASAAAIIATAGDRVEMHLGSMLMIHRAWSIAIGNAGDMQAAADDLAKLDEGQVSIFTARSNQEAGKVKKWLDAETRMTAEEAIERGFADAMAAEVSAGPAPKQAKAKASDVSRFAADVNLGSSEPGAVPISAGDQASDCFEVVGSQDESLAKDDAERQLLAAHRAKVQEDIQAARRANSPFLRALGTPPPVLGGMHR